MNVFSNKLAHFHINKCGGTSVKRSLVRVFEKPVKEINSKHYHEPLRNKLEILGDRFYEYTIVTTVRNPYDRIVSLYFFRKWHYRRIPADPKYKAAHEMPFEEWFFEDILKNPALHDSWQSDWLLIDGKLPENVHILKLENIDVELGVFLKEKYDHILQDDVRRLNRTRHKHYSVYMTNDITTTIEGKEKWLFDQGFYQRES